MTQSAVACATVPEAFQRTVGLHGDRPALRTLGDRMCLTWRQLDEQVRSVAAGLAAVGVGHGDPVAIMLPNTPECHIVDYAAAHIGAVPFAIFNSSAPEQIAHQLGATDSRVVVTHQAFLPRVAAAVAALGSQLNHVITVDGGLGNGATIGWEGLLAAADPRFDVDAAWEAIDPDDMATIIFTSGTSGPPKGALWCHRAVMANLRAWDSALAMPTESIVSFLPMAHTGGRLTAHYPALAYGATITACPDMTALPAHVADARPDTFLATPRFWEKLKDSLQASMSADPAARAALAQYPSPTTPLDGCLVPDAVRPYLLQVGLDRMKVGFVGGAPSSAEVIGFFRAAGVPLVEAYGSTETGLNIFNRVDGYRPGTAGLPLPGVEVRVLDDGEMLCRSEFNMVGYYGDPDATAEKIDSDGWLHTGDIAEIDSDGFITITDRKKDIVITASGKNLSPANIERAIAAETSLIGHIAVVGDRRRYITALITLDPDAAQLFAAHGLTGQSHSQIASSQPVRDHLQAAIDRASQRLSSPERVRRFAVLPDVWQPDSDELTATAKLKRKAINEKYTRTIEFLYSD
jgi:long-subunit acyl-CoA synthetase (AMP-forming)